MARRFTLVRLLLAVILINTLLVALFVLEIAGDMHLLSNLVPGKFGTGGGDWGNYVFLSLLFLFNAILVLGTGFAVVIPALLDRLAISPGRLKSILTNRAGVSGTACEAVVSAVRDEQEEERQQLLAGRWVFRIGAIFFVLAFPVLCFSFGRAQDSETPMFVSASTRAAVANNQLTLEDVSLYTADQVLGAVALDAPEIYDIRFSPITHNLAHPLMPTVAFLFRAVVGLILIVGLLAVFRGAALRSYTRVPEKERSSDEPTEAAPTLAPAAH